MRIANPPRRRVVWWKFQPPIALALSKIDEVWESVAGFEATLTCGTDGKHSVASLHRTGLAADFRVPGRYRPRKEKWTKQGIEVMTTRMATAVQDELRAWYERWRDRRWWVGRYDVVVSRFESGEAACVHVEFELTYRRG